MGGKNSRVNSLKLVAKEIQGKNTETFLADLLQANELATIFADDAGNTLDFALQEPQSLLPGRLLPLAKSIVITCSKKSDDGAVVSQRELTVTQFYQVYSRLRDNFLTKGKLHHLLLENPRERKGAEERRRGHEDFDIECIICMSEKNDVILPCAHSYCHACIRKWSFSSKECPLCRSTFSEEKDSWVIATAPSFTELAFEVHQFAQSMPVEDRNEKHTEKQEKKALFGEFDWNALKEKIKMSPFRRASYTVPTVLGF